MKFLSVCLKSISRRFTGKRRKSVTAFFPSAYQASAACSNSPNCSFCQVPLQESNSPSVLQWNFTVKAVRRGRLLYLFPLSYKLVTKSSDQCTPRFAVSLWIYSLLFTCIFRLLCVFFGKSIGEILFIYIKDFQKLSVFTKLYKLGWNCMRKLWRPQLPQTF